MHNLLSLHCMPAAVLTQGEHPADRFHPAGVQPRLGTRLGQPAACPLRLSRHRSAASVCVCLYHTGFATLVTTRNPVPQGPLMLSTASSARCWPGAHVHCLLCRRCLAPEASFGCCRSSVVCTHLVPVRFGMWTAPRQAQLGMQIQVCGSILVPRLSGKRGSMRRACRSRSDTPEALAGIIQTAEVHCGFTFFLACRVVLHSGPAKRGHNCSRSLLWPHQKRVQLQLTHHAPTKLEVTPGDALLSALLQQWTLQRPVAVHPAGSGAEASCQVGWVLLGAI